MRKCQAGCSDIVSSHYKLKDNIHLAEKLLKPVKQYTWIQHQIIITTLYDFSKLSAAKDVNYVKILCNCA